MASTYFFQLFKFFNISSLFKKLKLRSTQIVFSEFRFTIANFHVDPGLKDLFLLIMTGIRGITYNQYVILKISSTNVITRYKLYNSEPIKKCPKKHSQA